MKIRKEISKVKVIEEAEKEERERVKAS